MATEARSVVEVRRLQRTEYGEAYALQKEFVEARIEDRVPDLLVLTEHEPVVTTGRRTAEDAALAVDIPVVEIERGGEATYHGPGQLVAYPILKLEGEHRDLHRYLRDLEEVVIRVLAEFDVEGCRSPRGTGVWIGDQKVASIGVAVRRWVSWHGFALNVHTDLSAFQSFNPCGLPPETMTRLVDHADIGPGLMLAEVLTVKHFCEVFERDLPPPAAPPASLGGFPELPLLQ